MLLHGPTPNTTHANTPQTHAKNEENSVTVNDVTLSTPKHTQQKEKRYPPSFCIASLYHNCPRQSTQSTPPKPSSPNPPYTANTRKTK